MIREALDKKIDQIYMRDHYKPFHNGNTTRAIKRAIAVALTGEKECAECTEVLPTDEFYSIKENRDGFSRDCRVCRSDRANQNYYTRTRSKA